MSFSPFIWVNGICKIKMAGKNASHTVPGKGFEPPHLAALAPETSASTSFATRAVESILKQQDSLLFQRTANVIFHPEFCSFGPVF